MLYQSLFNFLITFSFLYLFVSGFSLIYNVSGVLHFPHSSVLVISSYIFYSFLPHLGLYIAALLCLIIGVLLGLLTESLIYSNLRQRNSSDVHILLSSLGVLIVFQSVLSIIFGDDTKLLNYTFADSFSVLSANITPSQTLLVLAAFLVWGGLLLVRRTTLGKAMSAVSIDPQLALTCGINKDRVILIAFAFGSAIAAVGGIFNAQIYGMAPTDGLEILLNGIVAMVVAGSHHPTSLLLGSALLAALYEATALSLGSQWQEPVSFAVLVVLLLSGRLGSLNSK